MIYTNSKYVAAALFSLIALMTFLSCERDIDDLEPAPFPSIGEVFLDDFSSGMEYSAFGTSKVTAFSVDTEVKYEGEASMKFEVPDADDPEGGYAGGVFFSLSGRDLTAFNVLTFWARATQPASIELLGFGNEGDMTRVSIFGLSVNTNWKKYYIPIPDPSILTREYGLLNYTAVPEDGAGYTFWLDEVQFEYLGTIAHPKAAILERQDQVIPAAAGDELPIGGLFMTFNLPTGVDQRVELDPSYYTFSSSNPSVATVGSQGVVSVIDSGMAVITATVGELEADGSLTVESSGNPVLPSGPAPTPAVSPDSVISMFSNAYDDVPIDTWNTGWEFSTAVTTDLQVEGDDIKRYTQLNFVGIEFSSEQIDATGMTHFHMDVWTPDPTGPPAAFKVLLVDFGADGTFGGGDDSSHELSFSSPAIQTEEWFSLDIPLSDFAGLTSRSNLAQLVLSGDLPTVFIDNVYFYKSGGGSGGNEPEDAAPTPTRNAGDVISIFSDAYTNVPGTDFNPDWGQATVVSQVPVDGNNTLFYAGLNYQGIQLGDNLDVSGMTHLHIDYWTANSAALNAFLISTGPVEMGYTLDVPTSGWASVDIPLTAFSPVNVADLIQFKFDGSGDIYLDNIYFYIETGGPTEPTEAAPVPTDDPGDVISVFSDAFTNIAGTNLDPDWGQATVVSEVSIDGNNTLLYSGLNYQGIELGNSQDVSGMASLHLDFWTANATTLEVFIISPGPVETPVSLTVPTSGWTGVDIPLTEFAPVDLADVFQFKFVGDGDVYLDNIYFRK